MILSHTVNRNSVIMKKVIALVAFLSLVTTVVAQNKKVEVFLKNGSIIKGKLIEAASPEQIKVKSGGTLWVFKNAEVDTVIVGKAGRTLKPAEIPYFINVEYGVLLGNSNNEDENVGFFHSSFNYRTVQNLYVGAGAGVEYFMEQTYIPAFAKFEYRFRQTRFSPLLFVKTGYLIPGENQDSRIYQDYDSRNVPPKYLNAKGGFMVNPGFGFTAYAGENFGFRFSVGYRYHSLSYTGKDKYELEQRYNRLCLALGITFK